MPPLRSNPEITVVNSDEERIAKFADFVHGEVAYQLMRSNGQKYEVFIPHYLDPQGSSAAVSAEFHLSTPIVSMYFPNFEGYMSTRDEVIASKAVNSLTKLQLVRKLLSSIF